MQLPGHPYHGRLVPMRKRALSIFSPLIFDSRVERGIPNRLAAPEAPNTRPPHARRASSMIAFSDTEDLQVDESWLSAAARRETPLRLGGGVAGAERGR